jgi:hypothetical protein
MGLPEILAVGKGFRPYKGNGTAPIGELISVVLRESRLCFDEAENPARALVKLQQRRTKPYRVIIAYDRLFDESTDHETFRGLYLLGHLRGKEEVIAQQERHYVSKPLLLNYWFNGNEQLWQETMSTHATAWRILVARSSNNRHQNYLKYARQLGYVDEYIEGERAVQARLPESVREALLRPKKQPRRVARVSQPIPALR